MILHYNIGNIELTLHKFKEELEMLIFNIEGNDNYGARIFQSGRRSI